MNTKNAGLFVLFMVVAAILYLCATNQIGPNAPRLQPRPASAEYGTAPKRITDIIAGDGAALTEEVNEQRGPRPTPILTERGNRR